MPIAGSGEPNAHKETGDKDMRLTFVSNYFNHHQKPLCEAFAHTPQVEFVFLQTEPMEEERLRMGWGLDITAYPYVRVWQQDEAAAREAVLSSDVVIWGGVETKGPEKALEERLAAGKLTFRYSERIYKEGRWRFISPRGLKQKYHDFTRYRKAPYYLLCAGAYAGSDYALVRAFPKKKFVWGYFPETKRYDFDELMAKKSTAGEPVRLLWAGRMIDWKHPEIAIQVADRMLHGAPGMVTDLPQKVRKNGGFVLTMAGSGEMEQELRLAVLEKGLEQVVRFTGFLKPEQIREEMERSDIFLFTSDEKEGWGAVLNEAMNSGCLVVARPEIGAVPYLLDHGYNGMINGKTGYYPAMTAWLIMNREEFRRQAGRAYDTIINAWNAENAAAQFLRVAEELLRGGTFTYAEKLPFENGPTGMLQPMCRDPELRPQEGARFARRW